MDTLTYEKAITALLVIDRTTTSSPKAGSFGTV
jgi:hypothetical protein